jgi:hypothetical protein
MRTSGNLDSSSSSGGLGTCPVGLGTQRDNGRPYGTCAGRRGTVAFPRDARPLLIRPRGPWTRVRRTTTRPSPARPTQASRQPDRGLVNARGHGYWYGSRTLRVAISCDDVASSPCARTVHGPRAAQLCRCGTGCPFRPGSHLFTVFFSHNKLIIIFLATINQRNERTRSAVPFRHFGNGSMISVASSVLRSLCRACMDCRDEVNKATTS